MTRRAFQLIMESIMKTVLFQGQQYEVPVWTKWLTLDIDGVYAWQHLPEKYEGEWCHGVVRNGLCERVGDWHFSDIEGIE
jgi:hypothetical protein